MATKTIRVLAIIAHDGKKVDLVTWATANRERLSRFQLIATATTGKLLRENVGLEVESMLSGPQGGDVQIASRIVQGEIDAVFFFQDPLDAHPHDPDIQAVMRVCNVHDVPIAPNFSTADLIIGTKGFRGLGASSSRRVLRESSVLDVN
ncbi:MAG: methylglyoxal synthase [Elusimicrobiota bacterium]